ncbi:hypothetical protein GF312_11870 [Candidatus Poribacteria bacterium]|nr:hypothetical protein [Candidatus Poribacteria bacterium]
MDDYPDLNRWGGGGSSPSIDWWESMKMRHQAFVIGGLISSHPSQGWSYDRGSGSYINRYTGGTMNASDFSSTYFFGASGRYSSARNGSYSGLGTGIRVMYETAFLNSNGKWIGNGNYGFITVGILEVDPFNQIPNLSELNWLGRQIQKRAGSEFSQLMFANYWTGGGDVTLSTNRFNDIAQHANGLGMGTRVIYNNQEAIRRYVSFYDSEYSRVFGTARMYYDLSGNPIGFFDVYDFNPYPIRWNSFFDAQLKTELIDMASWFNLTDRPFNIRYP